MENSAVIDSNCSFQLTTIARFGLNGRKVESELRVR